MFARSASCNKSTKTHPPDKKTCIPTYTVRNLKKSVLRQTTSKPSFAFVTLSVGLSKGVGLIHIIVNMFKRYRKNPKEGNPLNKLNSDKLSFL